MNAVQNNVAGTAFAARADALLAVFEKRWAQSALLLIVLLLLLLPTGVLTDNEENYFQLAAKATSGGVASPLSGVFDQSSHRFVFEHLIGNFIALVGFEPAQIITRALAAVAFALLLPAVFRLFALSAFDGAIVIIIFAMLGQTLMGGEWIFVGFEAKVIAYGFVLAALYAVRTRRDLIATTLFCAIATYFHFLVGIFWFAALLGLRLIDDRKDIARVVYAFLAFVLVTAPLTSTIVLTRLHDVGAATAADGLPSADVIFSLIREPWHGAPFLSRYNFIVDWLPGYLLAAGMIAGCIVAMKTSTVPKERRFALWLSLLIGYLFLALVPAFIERHTGVVGKFYPFRPAALILFLWLCLALSFVNGAIVRHRSMIKILTLALLGPGFFSLVFDRLSHDISAREFAADKAAIIAYVKTTSDSTVMLVDPAIENSFLEFERVTGRPFLISWKFAPTNDSDLREWYKRMQFREKIYKGGCPQSLDYRVDFLLVTQANAETLSQSCGPVVLKTLHWQLLRREPRPE